MEYRKPGRKMRLGGGNTSKPENCGLVAVYDIPQAGEMRLGEGEYTKPEKCGSVAVYGIPQAG